MNHIGLSYFRKLEEHTKKTFKTKQKIHKLIQSLRKEASLTAGRTLMNKPRLNSTDYKNINESTDFYNANKSISRALYRLKSFFFFE